MRIGNGAHRQLQLDIYGELMDAVYLYNKYAEPISYDAWSHLRRLVDWLCENWRRDGRRHLGSARRPAAFVYSKFMSWVAVDRGLRLADKRSLPADRNAGSKSAMRSTRTSWPRAGIRAASHSFRLMAPMPSMPPA